jgi:nucleoside-diphosphate-sugar epimerase
MSLVHVEDCAKLHVAALETPEASGRYMCLVESWHWNELLQGIKKHYPQLPGFTPCENNPIRPTEFDLTKRDSLGVAFRSMDTILQESIDYLKSSGEL